MTKKGRQIFFKKNRVTPPGPAKGSYSAPTDLLLLHWNSSHWRWTRLWSVELSRPIELVDNGHATF